MWIVSRYGCIASMAFRNGLRVSVVVIISQGLIGSVGLANDMGFLLKGRST